MSPGSPPLSLAASAFHRGARLGSLAFGGRWGQVPDDLSAPEVLLLPLSTGSLHALRWNAASRGAPLVLLHGLCENAWTWARAAALLCADRPVIALTLPGHGRSADPSDGYHLGATGGAVLAALDALGADQVVLGGHSWGGKVATWVATRAPERVSRLVLADPVLPQGLGPLLAAAPFLLDLAFAPQRRCFASREAQRAAAGDILHLSLVSDTANQRLWDELFSERSDGTWGPRVGDEAFDAIVREALQVDETPALSSLRAPTLLLRPTFTVAHWPGALRPLRKATDLTVASISGDHTFVHSNPLDTSRAISAALARWESR